MDSPTVNRLARVERMVAELHATSMATWCAVSRLFDQIRTPLSGRCLEAGVSDKPYREVVAELAAERERRGEAEAEAAHQTTLRLDTVEGWAAEQERRERAEADAAARWNALQWLVGDVIRRGDFDLATREAVDFAEAALADNCGAELPARLRGAEADRDRLLAVEREARALVDELPKCSRCSKPATRAFCRGEERFCDDHQRVGFYIGTPMYEVNVAPEYPRAAPLRALIALIDQAPSLPPVPRGHCGRCDRCGGELVPISEHGCWKSNCSLRPMPPPRSTCAGCGAPFEVKP